MTGHGPSIPSAARVVVIGGGVIGCSVAYHLADLGWNDVVVLERDRLTSGTTWHAAGLMVTFGSLSETATGLRRYTKDLYGRLEAETGQATGFAPVGFIELATDRDRLEEYRRVAAFNRYCGVDVHEISAAEVRSLFPAASTDDVLAGFFVEDDGRVNPADVTMALAAGARSRGVTIVEQAPVTELVTQGRSVAGVRTPHGEISTTIVVNCAGMWARQLGAAHGVGVPLQAAEHYYLLTDHIDEVSRDWPVIEDPASHGYYREEGGGLLVGLFEPVAAPWNVAGIPESFSFGEIPPDWDRISPYLRTAMERVPVTLETGIRKLFCGPESFTPDLSPLVGEAPELRGYFVAAGMNSVGILMGGGIGKVVAEWIVSGRPQVDVTAMNIDRFMPWHLDPGFLEERTAESLGLVFRAHYPYREKERGRDLQRGPLHERFETAGAHFRDVSGWETPDWYSPDGPAPVVGRSWGREPWFSFWEREHRAAREGCVLMDMSFMGKFHVEGPDAGAFLDRLSTAAVDDAAGRITYTQWLNEGGTIEADVTVSKLAEGRFLVVCTDTAMRHVEAWMRRNIGSFEVAVTDVTTAYAQLNIQGPRSRLLLERVLEPGSADGSMAYRDVRRIRVGGVGVICNRITYVGELGYELLVESSEAVRVYDTLAAVAGEFGARHAGLKALSSLRLEKAYRDYGHDIDNTDTLVEAGLGWTAVGGKPGGFIGDGPTLDALAGAPSRTMLVQVRLEDPDPLLFHGEVLLADGEPVGYLRSASYGFTLGGAVGLAMVTLDEPVTAASIGVRRWGVDVAGTAVPAAVSLRPMYDPARKRILG